MPLARELQDTLTMVLAGERGERLEPLTRRRAKAALPFGGVYRIIDFALSNCLHSGLRRIHVLTQHRARSLEEHVRSGWSFLPPRLGQYVDLRPPHHKGPGWYQGTADALYQNVDALQSSGARHVLVLPGDLLHRVDYGELLAHHLETGAALTIGAAPPVGDGTERFERFGCLGVDLGGAVSAILEEPVTPTPQGTSCLASSGVMLFEVEELVARLRMDAEMGPGAGHDLARDVVPRMVDEVSVRAHTCSETPHDPRHCWVDLQSIDDYFEANLDLCGPDPRLDLYDREWPLYTLRHDNPPAKTMPGKESGRRGEVIESLLCAGAVVQGSRVRRSILGSRVHTGEGSEIEDCLLFTGVTVGAGARLRRTIVDKWVEIPPGVRIGHDLESDGDRFTVTSSGIVVVPSGYRFS